MPTRLPPIPPAPAVPIPPLGPGQRRLILTRHAKSDWAQAELADHDRPLNARGHRAAAELGLRLRRDGLRPDEVLCSTARRTQETWAGTGLPAPEPTLVAALYHAEPSAMLRVLRGATGRVVMLLGHNPGIGALARMLPASLPHDPDFDSYPTAATLVVDYEIDSWAALQPRAGLLRGFFVPSERGRRARLSQL